MKLVETYLRARFIGSSPARPAKIHIYKSGANAGQIKNISARPASQGLIGVSEKTIWQWVRQGKFPQPIKLSANVTVWRLSDVQAWLDAKAEASDLLNTTINASVDSDAENCLNHLAGQQGEK